MSMKLLHIFESVMDELFFTYETDEDIVTIKALKNREVVGKVVLEFVVNGYREFEDQDGTEALSPEDYDKIFPNDSYVKIESLDVIDDEKGKGYAKQLLDKARSQAKKDGEKVMYLNASPKGFTGLSLNDLVGFYKAYGFEVLIDSGNNVEMFMNI